MSDFDKTYNAAHPEDVTPTSVKQNGQATTEPLEVSITGPGEANRLLIFSGIARVLLDFADDDGHIFRGLVRVRLNYRLHDSVKFISSSTSAALANIFNNTGEFFTFAVEDAATEPQAVDPNNPNSGLELVLTAHLAVQGEKTGISGMSYQAHVLVRDTNPELESILVRPTGGGIAFSPSTSVRAGEAWEYQINLTGPVVRPTELILLSSSDPSNIPISAATQLQQGSVSAAFAAPRTTAGASGHAIITGFFTRRDGSVVQKTATVEITQVAR